MDCWQFEDCRGVKSRKASLNQRTQRGLDPLSCPFDGYAEVLCFVCGDGFVTPCPRWSVQAGCAVGFWGGLCAVDTGDDGFGGCKAHGCGLLVKRRSSG